MKVNRSTQLSILFGGQANRFKRLSTFNCSLVPLSLTQGSNLARTVEFLNVNAQKALRLDRLKHPPAKLG